MVRERGLIPSDKSKVQDAQHRLEKLHESVPLGVREVGGWVAVSQHDGPVAAADGIAAVL